MNRAQQTANITQNQQSLNPTAEARLRREYTIMKLVEHPNVVKLIDLLENPSEIMLIMEYAADGDLFERINGSPHNRMTEDESRPIFRQIALGLQHLHKKGFIHRDVKPEVNIITSFYDFKHNIREHYYEYY